MISLSVRRTSSTVWHANLGACCPCDSCCPLHHPAYLLPPLQHPHQSLASPWSPAVCVPAASAARTSGTLLTHQGFQLHVSSHCRTPYLQAGTGGGALLASDGSVLQLGPTRRARAPLRRLPPAEVPYIINSLGAPYGVSDSGELLPLAVSSRGELWCGPDGHPLMLQPCPQHTTPPAAPIMQVVMASGSPMWLSTGAQVGCRVRRDVERSPVAPAVALAMVDLTSGQDLVDSQTGQRLKVDPASLELLGPGGRPAYDQRGRPLRLVGTQPPLHPGQQLLPLKPSVGLLAGCVLVLVLVAGLVLVAATCGCLGGLLTLLLAAAAWAALAGLAACTPAAVPLPHPVLLNVRGRPLRDARGQRLCLTSPDVTGQRHVVTDTGDMVCVSVDGAAGQPAKLVRSLPFLRGGGSAHDVLVDAEGRPLLGRQGAILRVRPLPCLLPLWPRL
jgi:membrane protein implicated in regulation of membrane protease activity